jgi:hypothetical protein
LSAEQYGPIDYARIKQALAEKLREQLRSEITSGDVNVAELTNTILEAIRDRLPSGGSASESTLSALNTKIPSDPAREGGNLSTIATNTGKLDVNLSTRATETTLSALNSKVQSQSAGLFVKDLSVGTSAIQVDTDSAYRDEVILLADSSNTDKVYVGTSASQLFPLAAGASVGIRKTSLNLIYVRAASGTQTVHVLSGGA